MIGNQNCLFVVTGAIKSDSWGLAAYKDPENSGRELELSRRDRDEESVPIRLQTYDWMNTGMAEARFGSNAEKVGESYKGKDQTLFIRGYTLAFSQEFRDRENALLQASLQGDLDNLGSDNARPNTGGAWHNPSLAGNEGATNSAFGARGGAADSLPGDVQVNYFSGLSSTVCRFQLELLRGRDC
jgi:hypothetical protein